MPYCQRPALPCPRGSGKLRRENYDARGIFLCFSCDDRHED
jgi:hypothetical protein